MSTTLFVISNLAITAGYVFLAIFVVPHVKFRLRRTRWGALGFFVLCGAHHLDNVEHVLVMKHEPIGHVMTSLHMLVIDAPQAICVWLFVTGLYSELVKRQMTNVNLPTKGTS